MTNDKDNLAALAEEGERQRRSLIDEARTAASGDDARWLRNVVDRLVVALEAAAKEAEGLREIAKTRKNKISSLRYTKAQQSKQIVDLALMVKWQPIETAPKDGTVILLLSIPDEMQRPARVAMGHWNPEGDSWVDEMGRFDGEAYELAQTGVWNSGGGWFQPNEVSHWMPLPAIPSSSAAGEEVGE